MATTWILFSVVYSEEDKCYLARCGRFPSLKAHGDTTKSAMLEILKLVTDIVGEEDVDI